MPISVTLTDAPVDVTVSADAGAVNVSAATVTAVQVAIGDTLSLKTSQVRTGGQPGTLVALNTLVDSINETGGWGDARANVIECADRSHGHVGGDVTIYNYDGDYPTPISDVNVESFLWNVSTQSLNMTGATARQSVNRGLIDAAAASHTHSANAITSGTLATARLASGTASASTYLRGDQTWAAISTYTLPAATASAIGGVIVGTGLGASSGTVSVTYGTTAGTACQGNDSRLSNARTPTSHAASHASGGSDPITVGTTADRFVVTSTGGKLVTVPGIATSQVYHDSGIPLSSIDSLIADAGSYGLDDAVTLHTTKGTTSNTVCAGNDSRLSNARTPTSHASSHASGGSDPIAAVESFLHPFLLLGM